MREALMAHIAFANDSQLGRILRHFIGTHHGAILAAKALIVEMLDDAREWVFLISLDRAAIQATRVNAMMAGCRDVLNNRQEIARERIHLFVLGRKPTDLSPRLVRVKAV